jgi:single-stranded DNA-binding protein
VIDALVAGRLNATPVRRTSKNGGSEFVTARMRASTADGSVFVNLLAFDPELQAQLLDLDAGASLCVSGPMKAHTYTDRDGAAQVSLEVIVQTINPLRHIKRKCDPEQPGHDH